jgi:alanine-glyoxylate transaminase/(R)-3-amino-2-methylpropionate-pyruvate transaminase
VTPDIVTMAKGIGNGAALGAVVTTPEIAAALSQRIHFNTFGGNPVTCTQGRAVLQVIDEDGIQANAARIGGRLKAGFRALQGKHAVIGDVRGLGLMLGIELVKDRATKEPAREECARVFETCRDLGLLVGKGGLWGNVLRIKPPMCLTEADGDFMVEAIDEALRRL